MRDPILNAAQDPSCILCLVPREGGSWMSRLRQGVVWPASTPPYFYGSYHNWYDFPLFAAGIPATDDFEHAVTVNLYNSMYGQTWFLFGNTVSSAISSIIVNNSGSLYWNCNMGSKSGAYIGLVLGGAITEAGIFRVTCSIIGTVATLLCEKLSDSGEVLSSRTASASDIVRVAADTSRIGAAISYFDGTMPDAAMRNLATGKSLHYPNDAERLQLIANKINVRTDRGCFEAAGTAYPYGWIIGVSLEIAPATILANVNGAVVKNPSRWSWANKWYNGAATDKLHWLIGFNKTLSAAEIAAFN